MQRDQQFGKRPEVECYLFVTKDTTSEEMLRDQQFYKPSAVKYYL
jgi:hypothetical protein